MISRRTLGVSVFLLAAGCGTPFPERIQLLSNEELYRAALSEFGERDWDNAILAFEQLSFKLPARDTLLSRTYWYLARSHEAREEHLLAAQTFSRLTESFPNDSLADDALLAAGRAYAALWSSPSLDAGYAQSAISTFQTLPAIYPNSDLRDEAEAEVRHLLEWLATKDYETGLHYLRRKAYDSAIIYFQDVIERYPNTPVVRDAYMRLVDAYRAINYREDAAEACRALRRAYPDDREARELCGDVPETVASPGP
ncbi:MAG: outer membrane protein assembly factor BamD [Gemmatimonadaceae bacterium]